MRTSWCTQQRQSIFQSCNGPSFPTTRITGDIISLYDPPWPLHSALYFICHQNCGIFSDFSSWTKYPHFSSSNIKLGLCFESLSRGEDQYYSVYVYVKSTFLYADARMCVIHKKFVHSLDTTP